MEIAGLQKTTLVDYPGKVAATVFTRGCTFRCGFCHNPELVVPEKFNPVLDEQEVIDFFEKRKNRLQGICITGGEPTIHKDIHKFIHKLKDMGYAVKLDTNGSLPDVLEKIIKSGDLDYIAMDIKNSLEKYSATANSRIKIEDIKKSIKMIMDSSIDYEFRTTVCHPFHQPKDFEEIGKLLENAKRYILQNFAESKQVNENQKFQSFKKEELKKAKNILKNYIKKVEIR